MLYLSRLLWFLIDYLKRNYFNQIPVRGMQYAERMQHPNDAA